MLLQVLLLTCAATAQEDVSESRRNAIVRAIEKAAPAVVTINVVDIRRERVDPFFDEFRGLFGLPRARPRLRERAIESVGSGFIFDREGHILTNYHVLQDADLISSVNLPDGRSVDAEFVGADKRTDLAVLKAKGEDLPFAPLDASDALFVGEWVIAIGNPFGTMMGDAQPSVSVGVVSAKNRRISREVGRGETLYQNMIQTDAAINPGNSGGPLVNAHGGVVGINTMIFSSSGGHQGLGFAIPANRARRVARELIEHGRRRNPWPGFRGEPVGSLHPYSVREMGIAVEAGVLITEIRRDSPAYEAGLRLGDVVVEINGEPVRFPLEVDLISWGLFVGDAVRLKIDRRGEPLELRFLTAELPSS